MDERDEYRRRALVKAEWQAEALEEAAEDCVPAMHQMANWLRERADWIRRQAREGAA